VASVVAVSWLFGGWVPALAMLATGIWWSWRGWPSVWLAWASAALMASVPFVWMTSAVVIWGSVSPQLVAGYPAAGSLAAIALATALLAVCLWGAAVDAPPDDPGTSR
jgi:hypothetical protein